MFERGNVHNESQMEEQVVVAVSIDIEFEGKGEI